MGIQAIKGVEVGDGFAGAARPGSQAHDEIVPGLVQWAKAGVIALTKTAALELAPHGIGVYEIRPDGSGRERILSLPGEEISGISWSPDGSHLAYTAQTVYQDDQVGRSLTREEARDQLEAEIGGYEAADLRADEIGIVGVGEAIGEGFRITGMVEKPAKGTAPSNFFINGRYILQPDVFAHLDQQTPGAGGDIGRALRSVNERNRDPPVSLSGMNGEL